MSQFVVGVDPGSCITGYGVIAILPRGMRVVDYGCLRTKSKQPLTTRYRIMHEGVSALLERYQPQALAVETQYVSKNVQSSLKLGMARGVVMLAATLREIDVFEYAPSKAKRAVVGNGSASKHQVKSMVSRLLGITLTSEDAADALALAICHAHLLTRNQHKDFQI